jgi:hypothetical protein
MSTKKKTETPKQESKTPVSDALIKTTKKGDIELSEGELRRATGGCEEIKSGFARGSG